MAQATIRKAEVKLCKVDKKLGLVFGYAIVCKTKNAAGEFEDYYDTGSVDEHDEKLYSDHIDESSMLEAVTDFMKSARIAKEMHGENDDSAKGTVVHSFPLTSDIAAALNIDPSMTGWLVAMQPDADMLAKFESGELTGFSIGGAAHRQKDVA